MLHLIFTVFRLPFKKMKYEKGFIESFYPAECYLFASGIRNGREEEADFDNGGFGSSIA